MARRKRKTYTAPALEKGLDILELLASESQPLAAPTIAARMNRTVGQVFRMIVVLEQRGYIAPAGDDRYRLTLRLFELAMRDAPIRHLTAAAVDTMAQLARDAEQSCHLVIYSSGRGIVIAQESAPTDRGFAVRLGAEAPLPESCSGHVLLAFSDTEQRNSMLQAQPSHLRKRIGNAAMQHILDRVLQRGYEYIESRQVAGVKDIGFPVFDHTGGIVAALVIPYLEHLDDSQSTDLDQCTRLLGAAAQAISDALGAPARG